MKKYLLGICAVVLAISFSAFSSVKSSKPAKFTTPYQYWYNTQQNGTKINVIESGMTGLTKDEVFELTECQDDDVIPVCLVGSDNGSLSPGSNFPTLVPDNHIRRTDQP